MLGRSIYLLNIARLREAWYQGRRAFRSLEACRHRRSCCADLRVSSASSPQTFLLPRRARYQPVYNNIRQPGGSLGPEATKKRPREGDPRPVGLCYRDDIMSTAPGIMDSCVQNLADADLHLAPVSTRHAAVLIPLYEDEKGDVQVLLTRRSSKLNSHAGEVALPGGKRDETDADDAATALREAHEEIGLEPGSARVIAELPPLLSKHGLSVKAVAAVIPRDFQATPNPDEVSDVFSVRLGSFLEESDIHTFVDKVWNPSTPCSYRVHFFQHGEYKVWGLTAAILIQAASIAFGRKPDFAVESESGGCLTQVHLNADGDVIPGRPPVPPLGRDGKDNEHQNMAAL